MATHLWIRAEQRPSERRVGIMPDGVKALLAAGFQVTIERSESRIVPIEDYMATGCAIADEAHWPLAPADAIIFGLKELPSGDGPLTHRHIMFGHAYKGQRDGAELLTRFKAGGGALYDLEYLKNELGQRVAAFGYWAGFAGSAVAVKIWVAQQAGDLPGPTSIHTYPNKDILIAELKSDLAAGLANTDRQPHMIVIGALGRVGNGASDLATALGLDVTKWDIAETAHGGPYPEILQHEIFVNCILADPETPEFIQKSAVNFPRRLSVIADVSCDPSSPFNPIPIYEQTTSFDDPLIRVAERKPPLDVTAIDNLPSMLPLESSQDYAAQLLPTLLTLTDIDKSIWMRARAIFEEHIKVL